MGKLAIKSDARLDGVNEVTADIVRRETTEALNVAFSKCRSDEGRDILHKIALIANHPDHEMLATYGQTLLKVIHNCSCDPPMLQRSQKDMSFHNRRIGEREDIYRKAAENRKNVVCAKSLFNVVCDFGCNYKYHYEKETRSLISVTEHLRRRVVSGYSPSF